MYLFKVECGSDSYTVRVNKNKYTCQNNGDTLSVQSDIRGITFNGTLSCPDYKVVCAGNRVSSGRAAESNPSLYLYKYFRTTYNISGCYKFNFKNKILSDFKLS